jgi:hypothetical protein
MAFYLSTSAHFTPKPVGGPFDFRKLTVANSPRIAFRQIRKIRLSGPLPTRTAARKLPEQFVGFRPTMIFENKLKVGFMPGTL